MTELPEGWLATELGEIIQFNYGKSLPDRLRSGKGFPVYGSNGIVGYHDTALTKGETIIVGRKGSVGEVHYSSNACSPIDTTYFIDQFFGMPQRFWFYLLKSLKLAELNKATAIPGLNREDAYRVSIPLPPLNEQKRIAAKLDALLERVDACRARLERVPLLLKRFRQAVLAAATSGQLTEDWRETHPQSQWQAKLLGELITEPKNGYSAKPVDYETPYKVLTLTATTSGKFDSRYFKYFDQEISTSSSLWLHPGDILIQRGNTIEYVGVPAIYNGEPNQFVYPDLMIKFRAKELVVTEFLYFALSDKRARNFLRQNATGTAGNMPKINQKVLVNVPINLPSLPEQSEIVRRVETLFEPSSPSPTTSNPAIPLPVPRLRNLRRRYSPSLSRRAGAAGPQR